MEGEFRALLQQAILSSSTTSPSSSTYSSFDTNIEDPEDDSLIDIPRLIEVESLAKQGLISKAASLLNSTPLAPGDDDTLQKLVELHPRRERPAISAINTQDMPVLNTAELVPFLVEAIKKSPRRSAPGPSGWRYEYLK